MPIVLKYNNCQEVILKSRYMDGSFKKSNIMSNCVYPSRGVRSSRFENKSGVSDDLSYFQEMPELCDVIFIVGDEKETICGIRAILAARSRVFHKMLYTHCRSDSPKKRTVIRKLRKSNSGEDFPEINNPRTVVIKEFDPDVFHQLIEYVHTGCVTLQAETVIGLMNAADHYGLDELRRACIGFMHCCINVDTVCMILCSAEKYIQYKSTKSLVQRALEFIDENGEEVLSLPAFTTLPEHVVRLVLTREELQAEEVTKFYAAVGWSRQMCKRRPGTKLKEAMAPFIDSIAWHLIPASILMKDVKQCGAVSDQKIMNALAFQADPDCVAENKLTKTTPSRLGKLSPRSLRIPSLNDSGSSSGLNQSTWEDEHALNSDRSCAMSTSSDLTDTSSSGGSFGRGDQKEGRVLQV
ncbi:serine-enriched protein-like isoform X2 [Anneissia japonica]|uniref:serine-enriched protein-like isoform X2 n=1 Tax=Anneissia japonica TaxID=1529436 RepID=UPI001425A04C|nr:serine-enriched protein-like isoform X2 [Anneissia japonica]